MGLGRWLGCGRGGGVRLGKGMQVICQGGEGGGDGGWVVVVFGDGDGGRVGWGDVAGGLVSGDGGVGVDRKWG